MGGKGDNTGMGEESVAKEEKGGKAADGDWPLGSFLDDLASQLNMVGMCWLCSTRTESDSLGRRGDQPIKGGVGTARLKGVVLPPDHWQTMRMRTAFCAHSSNNAE